MTGKWHTVRGGRFDSGQGEREFRLQGPLVSIAREPPQNSTDNPLNSDNPVVLRYSIRNIESTPEIKEKYFPQDPWIDHVTCPQNRGIVTYSDDYEETLIESIQDSIKVLLIEDYNATGLKGDPNMLFPNSDPHTGELDVASKANTFFWFMRSTGETRPQGGRGGSWGLGKLAFPLASAVRTFFVVTTRANGTRYLAGQAVLKNHQFRGGNYEDIMYYANDELLDYSDHHWEPISDANAIDDFCTNFSVGRTTSEPGTTIAIPLPKSDLDLAMLTLQLLSNYCVPIMNGLLEIEISPEEGDVRNINSKNIRNCLDTVPWNLLNRSLPGGGGVNPGWTTKGRMSQLISLYESMNGDVEDVL